MFPYFPLEVYPKMSQWKNWTPTELREKNKQKKNINDLK